MQRKKNGLNYAETQSADFLSLQAGSSKVQMLGHEINILKKVSHAHIIHLKEVYDTPRVSIAGL